MKKINSGLVILIFILIPCFAIADNFDQIRKDAANIKSIKASFVQKKSMKILSKPLISEGRFFYVAPDSFRWEYLKPLKSIVIANHGSIKRYIASSGKMVEDKSGSVQAMSIVMGEVMGWMSGKFDQNPSFKATVNEGEATEITLVPAGKNMTGMIERIELIIFRKTRAIKSIKIIENASSTTLINFSDVEINKPVNDNVFQDIE